MNCDTIAEHSRLIEDLGGPTEVAEALHSRLGVTMHSQAVSNWKRRGIPWRYRGTLVVIANEKGVSAPSDFFGITA